MVLTPRIDQINQYLAEQRQKVELSMHHVHRHQGPQMHHNHNQSMSNVRDGRDTDLRDQSYRDR